ncbi:MAG: hypothetical protein IT342_21865 [Candidatus Melainabacteria bacterium]|nr:hypothetical protein [Candidatus Melainabacteria bacterium]
MTLRIRYLVVPAYILGTLALFAAAQLLPRAIGLPIAGILLLVMVTPISLLHQFCDAELIPHFLPYGGAFCVAYFFAWFAIPVEFGPLMSQNISWVQVTFVAVQQALYLGVHAFRR